MQSGNAAARAREKGIRGDVIYLSVIKPHRRPPYKRNLLRENLASDHLVDVCTIVYILSMHSPRDK